jgi:exodeoxyribonuclease V beta subunit
VVQWLHNIVTTPLNEHGFSLSTLSNAHRRNELEFDFALDRVQVDRLNRLLATSIDCPVAPLTVDDFRGMITGVIDLVFVHEGRYYIADYKSNLLGYTLLDYTPDELRKTIFDRRYDLQYLLYLLALHRYLQQRIPDYVYAEHIGGAYYLFLRGMRPAHGCRSGVYFDLPPEKLIQELDNVIFSYQPIAQQVLL